MANGGTAEFALHCRGEVRLFSGDVDVTPKGKKGRALLAILAAEQRPLLRIKIIDLLWSDRPEEQARASLRTLLADIKEQLGVRFDDLLEVDRERIALRSSVRLDLTDPSLAGPSGELFEGLDHIDPELDDWLRLARENWREAVSGAAPAAAHSQGAKAVRPNWVLALLLAIAIAAVAVVWWQPWARSEQPVIAVLKFKDLTGRHPLLADGLAEELRIHLAQHSALQVIGRESSESPDLQISNAVDVARRKLSASHVIEGTLLEQNGIPAVGARLVETRSRRTIWTDLVRPEGGSLVRSASHIAARIANDVNETVGQQPDEAFEADARAYSDLFKARRLNGQWDSQAALEARSDLERVLQRYPRFAPALAAMAEATMRASDHSSFEGPIPVSVARREAARYAQRAIEAAPGYGLAYSAMGIALFGTGRELPFQRRALELSPGSVQVQRWLARSLELNGDMEGALFYNRRAVALEPLSLRMAASLERTLGITGRRSEIDALVRDFASRSDNRQDVLRLIQIASFDTGDLSGGYRAGAEALARDAGDWIAANNLMSMEVWFGRPGQALEIARRSGMPEQSWARIIIAGDTDSLKRRVLAAGRDFWSVGWAREDAAELLASRGHGDVLVALYDRTRDESGGREPRPDLVPGSLITALQEAGRKEDAAALLARVTPAWMQLARGFSPGRRAFFRAYLAAYAGNRQEAVRQLELAFADHWTCLSTNLIPLEETTAFRPLRGDPRFDSLMRRYHANIDRERRELALELSRGSNVKPRIPAAAIGATLFVRQRSYMNSAFHTIHRSFNGL